MGGVCRPLKAGEAREKCAQYFESGREAGRVPTAPGLALALGLEGRRQLEELAQGKGHAAAALRRGLAQIEEENIWAAYKRDSGPSARFILQNGFGYAEKPQPAPGQEVFRVRITGD